MENNIQGHHKLWNLQKTFPEINWAQKLQDQCKGKSKVCELLHEIKAKFWFACVIQEIILSLNLV